MTGPNPTDRAKSGTKHSVLDDERGVPLAIVVGAANNHDQTLAAVTLVSIVVARPDPASKPKPNLCMDKGYDSPLVRADAEAMNYIPHIRSRGEEKADSSANPDAKPRRWVVERTHSWLNRFRKIQVRYEKKACNYLGLLQFACAIIAWRATGILG